MIYTAILFAIIGGVSALTTLLWLYSRRASLLKFEGLQKEAESLLDGRLDSLVLAFQKEIPMASMFLTGSLAEKLKGTAKTELMKMVPELEKRLAQKALAPERKSALLMKAGAAAAIGALCGFVLGVIFAFFGAG